MLLLELCNIWKKLWEKMSKLNNEGTQLKSALSAQTVYGSRETVNGSQEIK